MDDAERIQEAGHAAAIPGNPDGEPEALDEDWVYDLDGRPWGVAEVAPKKLSPRRDGGGGITRRWIAPKVVPGGETGTTTVEVELHHQRRPSKSVPYGPLSLGTFRGTDWTTPTPLRGWPITTPSSASWLK
jgi:hypothetical protein